MYFKFSTIFDKIWAIIICLLFFIGNYVAPLFIFTETHHIVCNTSGQCKFYTTYLKNESKIIAEYNLNNIKSFSCKPSKSKKTYYLISINNFNEENLITHHSLGLGVCNQLKSIISNHNKNNELNYIYKPNPIKWYFLLIFIFGGLILTPWIIYTTIISLIKNK